MPSATTRLAGGLLRVSRLLAWIAARLAQPDSIVDDQVARRFHEARQRTAPRLGLDPPGIGWDDVPVSERLLTAAALRELADSGVMSRRR